MGNSIQSLCTHGNISLKHRYATSEEVLSSSHKAATIHLYCTVSGDGQLTIRWGCRCGEGRQLAHYIQSEEMEKDEKANGFWRHPIIHRLGLSRRKIYPVPLSLVCFPLSQDESAERADSSAPAAGAETGADAAHWYPRYQTHQAWRGRPNLRFSTGAVDKPRCWNQVTSR